jgi:CotS family spore coat protein
LEEQFSEVLSQYEINVHHIHRIRSGFFIEANLGLYLLRRAEGSEKRLEYEEQVTSFLMENGYRLVDKPVRNSKGQLITYDGMKEGYLLKRWYRGEECRVREREDLLEASLHLAKLHRMLKRTYLSEAPDYSDSVYLAENMERRTRELKRVSAYIRGKKRKNEFEISILNSFPYFYEQAKMVSEVITSLSLEEAMTGLRKDKTLVHGSYTYHNLLFGKEGIVTINFDKGGVGLQIMDFYYFLRKAMEKNGWKQTLGDKMLKEYDRERPFLKEEWELLRLLLSYPEKYWKILNHYYNNKKSWVAQKDIEKLQVAREAEDKKRLFLKEVFS